LSAAIRELMKQCRMSVRHAISAVKEQVDQAAALLHERQQHGAALETARCRHAIGTRIIAVATRCAKVIDAAVELDHVGAAGVHIAWVNQLGACRLQEE
jgi:hypothetical protein